MSPFSPGSCFAGKAEPRETADVTETPCAPPSLALTIDGHAIEASPGASLIQAWIAAGMPLTANVGCMGQGVCGACRVLVRREGDRIATTALACETRAEAGMQVAFVDHFPARRSHAYDLRATTDSWQALASIDATFPEAKHCRHCGGCDAACPKAIEVQKAVTLAVEGRALAAGALFEHCVMCNLCVAACPEHIAPAHLGQFLRRMAASLTLRPGDLIQRLREIEEGRQPIDLDGVQP